MQCEPASEKAVVFLIRKENSSCLYSAFTVLIGDDSACHSPGTVILYSEHFLNSNLVITWFWCNSLCRDRDVFSESFFLYLVTYCFLSGLHRARSVQNYHQD